MAVTLTSTKNQQDDEKIGNVSTINIGDCENILKDAYNISENETFFYEKNRSLSRRYDNTKN